MLRLLSRSASFKPSTPIKFEGGKANLYFDPSRTKIHCGLAFALSSGGLLSYASLNYSVLSYTLLGTQFCLGACLGAAAYVLLNGSKSNAKSINLLDCGSKVEVVSNGVIMGKPSIIDIKTIVDTSNHESANLIRARNNIDIFIVKPNRRIWIANRNVNPENAKILKLIMREGKEVKLPSKSS
jgi:hypothetical protein